jgi:hypothetical protein
MMGTAKRLPTGADPSVRPMTSNKAAGFSKNLGKDPREVDGI